MSAAHALMQSGSVENTRKLLGPLTVRQYLGEVWVRAHPSVKPAIAAVEEALNEGGDDTVD